MLRTLPPPSPARRECVAYIMSRFPKLTETFVLYEILAVESLGVRVEIFPLLRQRPALEHPEAHRLTERARFEPFLSASIVRAMAYFACRHPRRFVRAVWEALWGTWRSPNLFVGALGILPKSMRFAHEMQRLGVSHVHAHFATHPALAALVVHRLTDIPFSFTAHGSDLHVRRRMLATKVGAAAFVAAISRYNRDVILAECGAGVRDKVHVVHCGVAPVAFPEPRRRSNGAPLRIVCVASFESVKGHAVLLRALEALARRGIPFECDLIGDGPLRGVIESERARLDLTEAVHLRGARTRAEVFEFLGQAHVAVLASVPTPDGKREGIPVVLMEAMAAGLPVVASRLSGIPELVEDGVTGFLAEPRDSDAIAAALEAVARDPERAAAMGRAGRDKVRREFDLDRNAALLVAHIRASAGDDRGVEAHAI